MEHDVAGDPMTALRWTRKTTEKIRRQLRSFGIRVCRTTVAKQLRQLGYSLRVNHKKVARRVNAEHRNRQFQYIKRLRGSFLSDHLPVISVDTKKRELVGNFKNAGRTWEKEPILVNDHDFRSDGKGIAVPYGVFDIGANRVYMTVGVSHDTPEFAVHALATWWARAGRMRYPKATRVLVLADNGGSNSSRARAWKIELQRLCDRFGISVTVCHYPPGASKWNPIEHRAFSAISLNWAGRPLDTYETVLKYLRSTTNQKGLQVRATLDKREYLVGAKVAARDFEAVNLTPHRTLAAWNYTISPTARSA